MCQCKSVCLVCGEKYANFDNQLSYSLSQMQVDLAFEAVLRLSPERSPIGLCFVFD